MPKPMSELPDNQVVPNLQHEKRTYRYFSAAEKKRILAEADACAQGELGHCYAFHGRLTKPPKLEKQQIFKTATIRRVPLVRNVSELNCAIRLN